MGFGQESGAPVYGGVNREERQEQAEVVTQRQTANAVLQTEEVATFEEATKYRTFVASREHASGKFLIKAGTLVQFRDPNSPTGQRDARRDGDKYAKFTNKVLVTDDPDVIAWCESHPEICRNANDANTPLWDTLKEMSTPTASRDIVDQSLNADLAAPVTPKSEAGRGTAPETGSATVDRANVERERIEQAEEARPENRVSV